MVVIVWIGVVFVWINSIKFFVVWGILFGIFGGWLYSEGGIIGVFSDGIIIEVEWDEKFVVFNCWVLGMLGVLFDFNVVIGGWSLFIVFDSYCYNIGGLIVINIIFISSMVFLGGSSLVDILFLFMEFWMLRESFWLFFIWLRVDVVYIDVEVVVNDVYVVRENSLVWCIFVFILF